MIELDNITRPLVLADREGYSAFQLIERDNNVVRSIRLATWTGPMAARECGLLPEYATGEITHIASWQRADRTATRGLGDRWRVHAFSYNDHTLCLTYDELTGDIDVTDVWGDSIQTWRPA